MEDESEIGKDMNFEEMALEFEALEVAVLLQKIPQFFPRLSEICKGKVYLDTHRRWYEGSCKTRNGLTLRSYNITCVTAQNASALYDRLVTEFCVGSMKLFGYTIAVLFPEAIKLLIMDHFNVTVEEAESIMWVDVFAVKFRQRHSQDNTDDDTDDDTDVSPARSPVRPPSQDEAAEDILQRGKRLQLCQKRKKSGSIDSNVVPVTVSLMKKKKGVFCKEGTPIEYAIDRHSSYDDLLKKSCEVLSSPLHNKALFTSGGALIKNVEGWTLAQYMRQLRRGTIKIGVGDLQDTPGKPSSQTTTASSGYSTAYNADTILLDLHGPEDTVVLSSSEGEDKPSTSKKRKRGPSDEPNNAKKLNRGSSDERNNAKKLNRGPSNRESRQPSLRPITDQCMEFSAKELSEATRHYTRASVLGRGGFGVVYKGYLRFTTMAVKVLSPEGKAALSGSTGQFQAEVSAMNRFRHQNILQLLGYCSKPAALVFEFMANGSVYQKLHEERSVALTWVRRRSIIADTCRGMVYLHTATPPTVHQDIKTANILLDESFKAKLGDFGFSIELPTISTSGKTMFTSQCIVRSEGYYPSEVAMGKYSDRSDVYSFGVVVLEIWTGLKAFDSTRRDPKLIEYVQDDLCDEDKFRRIFDSLLPMPAFSEEVAKRYYDVVTSCLKKHSTRPPATEVMKLLG